MIASRNLLSEKNRNYHTITILLLTSYVTIPMKKSLNTQDIMFSPVI